MERETQVNNSNSLWHAIKSFFTPTQPDRKFIIVYPPLNTTEENLKPWEYLREPDEYDKFWKAKLAADEINRKNGRVIAIVCECPVGD